MKKFVISYSEYMEEPWMESEEAESLIELLKDHMGAGDYINEEEWAEDIGLPSGYSDGDIIEKYQMDNGDGGPYVMIFDVEADEQVIR